VVLLDNNHTRLLLPNSPPTPPDSETWYTLTDIGIFVKHNLPAINYDYWQGFDMDFQFLNVCCELASCWTKELVIACCGIRDIVLWTSDWSMLVTTLYWTLLHDKSALKTIASPLHRVIVLADTITHQTIRFLRYCPDQLLTLCITMLAVWQSKGTSYICAGNVTNLLLVTLICCVWPSAAGFHVGWPSPCTFQTSNNLFTTQL